MLLKLGSRGEEVKQLQKDLKYLGYPLDVDGIFGKDTKAYVEIFQIDNGLNDDGIVGKDTFKKLEEELFSCAEEENVVDNTPWVEAGLKDLGIHEVRDEEHVHQMWRDAKLSGLTKFPASKVPWCFTGDVEVLTEKGFVKFKNLTESEKVWQVDDSLRMSLTSQNQLIKVDNYEGKFFRLNLPTDSFTFTDTHRWWGRKGSRKVSDFHLVKDLTKVGMSIPFVESSEDKEDYPITDQDLKKLVIYLTDGTLREKKGYKRFEVQVSKDRKIKYLDTLNCHEHCYTQSKIYNTKSTKPLTVYSFTRPLVMEEFVEEGKNLSWDFVKLLSNRQCALFLETYAIFDGTPLGHSKKGANHQYYYSNLEVQIDQLQYMHLRLGQETRKGSSVSKLSGNTCYNLSYVDRGKNLSFGFKPEKIEEVTPKDRTVYCVSVPEQKIIVRGEKGSRVLLTGNCSGAVCSWFERVGIRSARTDGAKNWLNWGVKLEKPAQGCVVVFTRKGGGHVGLVMGEDEKGNLLVLGGNQGDQVNIKSFDKSRVAGYRYPEGYEPNYVLSKGDGTELSRNEV